MASAPRTTLATLMRLAPFNSPKSSRPQRMPTSELVFQRGKAMARPTSRMAKTVRVLATAQSMPARMAMGMRCLFWARSAKTWRVPLSSVGNGPASGEDARHHAERDGVGRESGVDELGGRLSRAQPYAGCKSADDADAVNRLDGREPDWCGPFRSCLPDFSLRFDFHDTVLQFRQ